MSLYVDPYMPQMVQKLISEKQRYLRETIKPYP